ncbi:MAG: hypothetical protein AAFX78_03375 [Cyanobacteria bacterium J06638_20]
MPRRKTAAAHSATSGMVTGRFRRRGIADQVLAAVRHTSKTPVQICRFLGLNVGSETAKNVEVEMDKLIKRRELPIQKKVNQGKGAHDRTVKYARVQPQQIRAPKATPAAVSNGCKVWVDESVKGSWSGKTQADISAAKKQNCNQVAANEAARQKAERARFRKQLKRVSRPRNVKPCHVRQFLAQKRSATEAELQQALGEQAIAVVAEMPDVESGGVGQVQFFYLSEATAS